MKSKKFVERNRNARIAQVALSGTTLNVLTANRDEGTLRARANVRERIDVETGRSLTGLSVQTSGGRYIHFTGAEARTLFRVLDQAVNG